MQTEIVGSRAKAALVLLASLGLATILLFLPGDKSLWGAAFFAVGAMIAAAVLVRPQRLLLDQDGFILSGGLTRSPTKIAWRDVNGFFVVRVRPGASFVGFNYSASAADRPRRATFSRALAGAEGALPGGWPGSATDMADALNAYRQRTLESAKP